MATVRRQAAAVSREKWVDMPRRGSNIIPSLRLSLNLPPVRFCSALLLGTLGPTLALGESATPTRQPEPENPEEFSRVRGLFDVDLPKTVEKFRPKLIVHPHFGDFLHRGYLRLPVGARVGVNDHTEINAEVESYLTHGLKGRGPGYGIDLLSLGAKYQWQRWLRPDVDASTGFNASFPVGRPPLDLTDGHTHFSPYVTFSRRWPEYPRLTPFVSLGTNLMWKSSVPGSFIRNQPHSDTVGGSAGAMYDRDILKYTVVFSYWTTALIGRGDHHFVSLNPSVLWQLPRSLTFYSDGRWIFGIGLKATLGPDGTEFGTSAKLRGEFRFLRRFRSTPNQAEKK